MAKAKPPKSVDDAPIPALELTPAQWIRSVRTYLQISIDIARSEIARLSNELARTDQLPLHTLSGSARCFSLAAELQVAIDIIDRLDAGESLVLIHEDIRRKALKGARSNYSSTNPIYNFVDSCKTEALAEFEDYLAHVAKKLMEQS